jgi:hypothetical protein
MVNNSDITSTVSFKDVEDNAIQIRQVIIHRRGSIQRQTSISNEQNTQTMPDVNLDQIITATPSVNNTINANEQHSGERTFSFRIPSLHIKSTDSTQIDDPEMSENDVNYSVRRNEPDILEQG